MKKYILYFAFFLCGITTTKAEYQAIIEIGNNLSFMYRPAFEQQNENIIKAPFLFGGGLNVSFSQGFRFNQHIYLGGGIEFYQHIGTLNISIENKELTTSINSLDCAGFADFRWYILDRNVTPILGFKTGLGYYHTIKESEHFIDPTSSDDFPLMQWERNEYFGIHKMEHITIGLSVRRWGGQELLFNVGCRIYTDIQDFSHPTLQAVFNIGYKF